MRREAPRNNPLERLAGADLGWSRGQRVSYTLRPREACWGMQCRHGVPESLKPTETSYPGQGSQDNVGNAQKYTHRSSPAGGETGESPTGMTPQLYACMIDGGGCQGRLQERGCREGGEAEDE